MNGRQQTLVWIVVPLLLCLMTAYGIKRCNDNHAACIDARGTWADDRCVAPQVRP